MRTVLYIDKSDIFGGAEECLRSLMSDLDRTQFRPCLCLDRPLAHHDKFGILEEDIRYRVRTGSWWSGDFSRGVPIGLGHFQRFMYALRLRDILKHVRPDLVHLNLYRKTSYLDIVTAKRAGAIVIVHVRSLASQVPLSRRVLNLCDGIICTSDAVRKEVALINPDADVRLVYDGVHCDQYIYEGTLESARNHFQLPLGATVISSVGMLDPRKGHDAAIKAFALIRKRIPEAVLLVVGSAPFASAEAEQRRLVDLATAQGVDKSVFFLGHCRDMSGLYAASDIVFALSHDGEAFGRVPVEAACAGRPVIATALGATPEIIESGVTGILVSPEGVGLIAEEAVRLLQRPEEYARIVQRASARVEVMFQARTHAEKVQAFYKELIQRRNASRTSRA